MRWGHVLFVGACQCLVRCGYQCICIAASRAFVGGGGGGAGGWRAGCHGGFGGTSGAVLGKRCLRVGCAQALPCPFAAPSLESLPAGWHCLAGDHGRTNVHYMNLVKLEGREGEGYIVEAGFPPSLAFPMLIHLEAPVGVRSEAQVSVSLVTSWPDA